MIVVQMWTRQEVKNMVMEQMRKRVFLFYRVTVYPETIKVRSSACLTSGLSIF
jgi:hypothetical protein